MKTMRKRKKRTTTGNRLAWLALALFVFLAAPVAAEKKPKKSNGISETFAVIGGSVFRPPGFSLPGAEIEVTPESGSKSKTLKAVSDSRGEFAIRVPPVPMKYKVDVKCNGFQPQQQSVAVEGEQQTNLTFQLEPAAK